MNIKALRDEVIVRRITEEKTKNGIIIPNGAKKCLKATVLSVGKRRMKGKTQVAPEVSEGDTIVFPQGTGQLIDTGDEKLLMIKHDDILGILA